MNIFIMKRKLLMAVLMFLGLGGALKVNAQNWTTGATPASVAGKTTKVVLYNVATNCYIGGSGMWGTQLYVLPSGKFYTVTIQGSSSYYFQFTQNNSTRYIGWGNAAADENFLFINATSSSSLTFTSVEVEGKTNVYNISLTDNTDDKNTVWLKSNGRNNALTWDTTQPDASDAAAQWMIIQETDFAAAFNAVAYEADLNSTYANGTNLLQDPLISAYDSEASKWLVSGSSVKSFTSTDPIGNLANAEISDGNNNTYLPTYTTDKELEGNYVYAGEGYGSKTAFTFDTDKADGTVTEGLLDGDEQKLITADDYTNYNADNRAETYMGKYWTANIHGTANVYQTISTKLTSGWYTISCKGFTTDEANLYAKVGDNTQKTALMVPETAPATYALAGYKLQTGDYSHSVTIYVPDNTTSLEIGVEGVSGWTSFNNFSIVYFGIDRAPYLYFNEDDVNTDNMDDQENNEKHCLYLRRKMTDGQWNSLVLPIDVKAPQILNAFGANTKLAKLRGIEEDLPYTIKYDLVDLTNNENGIEAGQLYIIKPSKSSFATNIPKNRAIERVSKTDDKGLVNITIPDDKPIYFLRNVVFKTMAENTNGLTSPQGFNVPGANEDYTGLQHFGTYVYKTQVAPSESFLLGTDGSWHLTAKAMDVRGFRTWIETTKAEEGANITFSINGVVEDGGVVTGIEGLEITNPAAPQSQNVYDLNGRVVSNNGSTEGLAKGIYIVNGKKVIK